MATVKNNGEIDRTPVKYGFNPPCLRCGERGGISVKMKDIRGEKTFHCEECDNEYGYVDVKALFEEWTQAVNWIDMAPVLPKEEDD